MFHYMGKCSLNKLFISLTLIMGVLGTVLALTPAVGKARSVCLTLICVKPKYVSKPTRLRTLARSKQPGAFGAFCRRLLLRIPVLASSVGQP